MSPRPEDDPTLDPDTHAALRARDELLPTTEAEVERAEAALPDELALPANLRSYRPRASQPDNLRGVSRSPRYFLGYAVATALGALAAGAALSWFDSASPLPVSSAGGELVRTSASAHPPPVPLVFQSRCERDCCAGSSCKTAPAALAACPSGLRCAACTPDNVHGGPYRLRVGTVIVSDAGQKLLPLNEQLELCVAASATETSCLPALGGPGGEAWRLLGVVSPLQDLLTGLSIELKKRGENAALAGWKHAVSATADILCKGLAIQLNDGTETLGRLSIFVEPTHFVELARASAVPDLLQSLRRFDVSGAEPRIFETTQPGERRFALALGPFDKSDAEALRWQVLDHGLEATVALGLDFTGSPRPAH